MEKSSRQMQLEEAAEISDLIEKAGEGSENTVYINGRPPESFEDEGDLLTKNEFKVAIKEQTHEIVQAHSSINTTLVAINKSLDGSLKRGFEVGKVLIYLFTGIVAVFFVLVLALGFFVFHLSETSVRYQDFYMGPSKGMPTTAPPAPPPVVTPESFKGSTEP